MVLPGDRAIIDGIDHDHVDDMVQTEVLIPPPSLDYYPTNAEGNTYVWKPVLLVWR